MTAGAPAQAPCVFQDMLGIGRQLAFVVSCPRLKDCPIIYASDGFYELTGYGRDEVLGKNCRFLQGPDTEREKIVAIRDAIREEKPISVLMLNYKKDKAAFWNLFHLAPIRDNSGQVAWLAGIQCEVLPDTVAKLCEHEGSVPLVPGEGDDPLEYAMPLVAEQCSSLTAALERRAAEWAREVVGDRGAPQAEASDVIVVPGVGTPAPAPSPSTPAAAQQLPPLLQPVRPLAGAPCTSDRLRSSLLQKLVQIQQSFCLSDPSLPDCPIVHASETFLSMTGYPPEEVLGRNCRFLQGEGTDRATVQRMREAIDAHQPVTVQLLNYRKDGTPFWNNVHVAPVRDAAGKVVFYAGVQCDVTAQVEGEQTAGAAAAAGSEGGVAAHGGGGAVEDGHASSAGEEEATTVVPPAVAQMGAVGKVRVAVRTEALRR